MDIANVDTIFKCQCGVLHNGIACDYCGRERVAVLRKKDLEALKTANAVANSLGRGKLTFE